MSKKRIVLYSIAFILLGALTFWAWHEPDSLEHLSRTEEVSLETVEAEQLVRDAITAIEKRDRRKLAEYLLSKDPIDAGMYITQLQDDGKSILPIKIIACTKLAVSHRQDNLTVHIYSEPRKKSYGFSMYKNAAGEYKLLDIGSSRRKP